MKESFQELSHYYEKVNNDVWDYQVCDDHYGLTNKAYKVAFEAGYNFTGGFVQFTHGTALYRAFMDGRKAPSNPFEDVGRKDMKLSYKEQRKMQGKRSIERWWKELHAKKVLIAKKKISEME